MSDPTALDPTLPEFETEYALHTPVIDAPAAARWLRCGLHTPWLHEQAAQHMLERLSWITQQPTNWCHWGAVRGGAHDALRALYPQASCHIVEPTTALASAARTQWQPSATGLLQRGWQHLRRTWGAAPSHLSAPVHIHTGDVPQGVRVDMLWANMVAHTHAQPAQLLGQWLNALEVGGFVMFSCLGPDTARQLRSLYREQSWGAFAHTLTDMHDWGDMLVRAGFADPVMDMQRLTLTFASPQRLLQELRDIGRNLHPQRWPHLRGRGWKNQLLNGIATHCANPAAATDSTQQPLALSVEIIYGHAIRAQPSVAVQTQASVSLQDMRRMLRRGRSG